MKVLSMAAFHNNVANDQGITNRSLFLQGCQRWMYYQKQHSITMLPVMNVWSLGAFHNNVVSGECIINSLS